MKKLIANYDSFIFDFDGTLVYSMPINWTQLKKEINQLSRKNGLNISVIPNLNDKYYYIFNYSDRLKRGAIETTKKYEKKVFRKLLPQERVLKLFKEILIIKGKNIFIISNNTSLVIKEFLRQNKVKLENRNIFSLDRLDFPKSSLNFYSQMAKIGRLNKKRTIYIGNSRDDKLISEILGIRFLNIKEI